MTIYVVVRSIEPYGSRGGLERASRQQVEGLRSAGFGVTIVTSLSDSAALGDDDVLNVPWPRFPRRGKQLHQALAYLIWCRRVGIRLGALLRSGDAVILHGASAHILRRIADWNGVRVVNPHGMEEFGPLTPTTFINRSILRLMLRGGSRHATWVVATDSQLVQPVAQNLAVDADKIVTIPNSVDIDALDRWGDSGAFARANGGRNLLVSVGRMELNKGYDLLAQSLSCLSPLEKSTLHWVHFGTGSQQGVVQALLVGEQKLTVEIVSGASDEEVHSALRQATIFVQPSRYEGSSITTLEAMAHGCLVVATRVGGIPDKIETGVSGILVEPDVDSICAGLRAALLEIESGRYGRAARQVVEERFRANVSTSLYVELLVAPAPEKISGA